MLFVHTFQMIGACDSVLCVVDPGFRREVASSRKLFLWRACHHKGGVVNHGLRGSASPVLMATGLVSGRRQFSAPYKIDTP